MIIDEKMLEEIVNKVIKKIEVSNLKEVNHSKRDVLVFNKTEANNNKILQLKEKWNVIECREIINDIPETVDKAIFLDSSQDILVKGAIGIADTTETELLANVIRLNIPIELVPSPDFKWFLQLKNKNKITNYDKKLLNYKEDLESFGVHIVEWRSLVNSDLPIYKEINNTVKEFQEKLLTKDMVENSNYKIINVSKTTIITPLAKDKAKELGKTISINDFKKG